MFGLSQLITLPYTCSSRHPSTQKKTHSVMNPSAQSLLSNLDCGQLWNVGWGLAQEVPVYLETSASWKAYGLSEWGSTPPSCPSSLWRSSELPAPDTQMSLTAAQHLIPRQRTSYLRSVHGALWGRSTGRGDLNLLHLPSGEVIADRNTCLAAVESCACLVCALVCVWC